MSKTEELSKLAMQMPSISRPGLVNHHSNSLPSTPYRQSRKLSFGSRSPSPRKADGDGSPRSVKSESDSGLRSQGTRPLAVGCQYETGMAFSRRRIPYSVGGDLLERPKSIPKKYLNPMEENKLSGDMRELYDRILPSTESESRRTRFVQKLEKILNERWPGNEIQVHVFGSSGNMLCTSDSDVDICITTRMKKLERVCLLAEALAEHGMERVVCVSHAKVPIVKVWDPELEIACDMNVNNTLALENTRMIKTYVEIDERVRPLAMIIKHWTKRRILNDAALGGTLSSYTWICMILNFLQTRSPPVLPCLHKRPHQRLIGKDGIPSAFADDLITLRGCGHKNKETLGDLLFHFFRKYAYELDYERNVVSVREGQLISKHAKGWHLMQNNRLCVEEPFNTERNLGNTADDISFRGVHMELRRAFELVSEAKLEECVEQYKFPELEEKIWEKPLPKPVPVLTRSRSQSQSGRGGKGGVGNRGGRYTQHQHRAREQGRRASSAAAPSRYVGPQLGIPGTIGRDHPLRAHFEQLQLHDQLFNEYQILQAQEHELRLLQAQAQLHAQAQAQGAQPGVPLAHQTTRDSLNRPGIISQAPLTAPLRSGNFYPIPYPSVPGTPYPGVHTNPSSPSMKHAQPELRRSAQRSSAGSSSSNAGMRSHSQPARPLPFGNLAVQSLQPFPLHGNAIQQYQQLYQQPLYNPVEMGQTRQRHHEYAHRRSPMLDSQLEETLPKEYVGYYVHDSPHSRPYRDDPAMARMPVYNDPSYRYRTLPPGFQKLRHTSRSPSPSTALPFRDRSYSIRSAASAPPGPMQPERAQATASGARTSGPIIVNGSDEWGMNDYPTVVESSSLTTTTSEATSGSDERLHDTPVTLTDMIYTPDIVQHSSHAHPTPHMHHATDSREHAEMESLVRLSRSHVSDPSKDQSLNTHYEQSKPVNGLGIQYEDAVVRRQSTGSEKAATQENVRHSTSSRKVDNKIDNSKFQHEKSSQPIPILSPVREVRTPSPVASRRSNGVTSGQYTGRFTGPLELHIPPFSKGTNGKQKQPDALVQKPNGVSSKVVESPKTAAQQQSNGWQQPAKKGKKHKSKTSLSQLTNGEPLPANEAERKGG